MSISLDMLTILAPALVAGALISLAHVPLGIEVLKRGIIFLDLAVAQCAALGMLAFHVYVETEEMDPDYAGMLALLCGLGTALFCAFAFNLLERRAGQYQEALIGCAFVFAASFSLIIISGDPHSGEQMKDILAGQILWADWSDLLWAGPVFILTGLLWALLKQHRPALFYPLFALTIPFSVKLIGVYLVFTSLIIPALATVKLTDGKRYMTAYLVSVLSFAAGLYLSYAADLPSGPAIICLFPVIALITRLITR